MRRLSVAFDFSFSTTIHDGRVVAHPAASFERDPGKRGRAQLLEQNGQNHWHEFLTPQELKRELRRARKEKERSEKDGSTGDSGVESTGVGVGGGRPLALDFSDIERSYRGAGGVEGSGAGMGWGGVLDLSELVRPPAASQMSPSGAAKLMKGRRGGAGEL